MCTRSWSVSGCAVETLESRHLLSVPLMAETLGESLWGYVETGDRLFILSGAFDQSTSLWVSDGTLAGTDLVRTFSHAEGSQHKPAVTVVNDKVLLAVNDGVHGYELWTTDGTPAGTCLLADMNPGGGGSRIQFNNGEGSTLKFEPVARGFRYFIADDGTHGSELWRTDGTSAGTYMIKDINPGSADCISTVPAGAVIDGVMYFGAETAANGVELWRSDGTPAGTYTVKDIVPGEGGSNPFAFTEAAGGFVFFASGDLYYSDGTGPGTSLLWSFDESWLIEVTPLSSGKLLFAASGLQKGWELWTTDGTVDGTYLLKDINFGPGDSYPVIRSVVSSGTVALFTLDAVEHIGESWRTDGTTVGTWMIHPHACSPNGELYNDGTTTYTMVRTADEVQLWRSDGTINGTVTFNQWPKGPYEYVHRMHRHSGDGLVYFMIGSQEAGWELWITDGTAARTRRFEGVASGAQQLVYADVGPHQLFFGNSGDGLRLFTTGTGGDPVVTPGPLEISGTDGNDVIVVGRSGNVITYTINGLTTNVPAEQVTSIHIQAADGDDTVTIDTSLDRAVTTYGGAGNDSLYGSRFGDLINGGAGNDLIYGSDGNDTIYGEDGIDTIYGNFGNDVIAGGLKRDSLLAGLGDDTITAGDGPDSVYGGDGRDLLRGGKGADYIEGRGKADTIYGGAGNDSLRGGAGSDMIYGESEDDRIDVGASAVFHDTVDGGLGYDLGLYDDDDVITDIEGLLT